MKESSPAEELATLIATELDSVGLLRGDRRAFEADLSTGSLSAEGWKQFIRLAAETEGRHEPS